MRRPPRSASHPHTLDDAGPSAPTHSPRCPRSTVRPQLVILSLPLPRRLPVRTACSHARRVASLAPSTRLVRRRVGTMASSSSSSSAASATADEQRGMPGMIDVAINLLDPMYQGVYNGKHAHPRAYDWPPGRMCGEKQLSCDGQAWTLRAECRARRATRVSSAVRRRRRVASANCKRSRPLSPTSFFFPLIPTLI